MNDQWDTTPRPSEPAPNTGWARIRPHELAWRLAGDEVVVLDLVTSRYHSLNRSGALLWRDLADWKSTKDLTDILIDTFGIQAVAAARDVDEFLDQCSAAGLLELRAAPAP